VRKGGEREREREREKEKEGKGKGSIEVSETLMAVTKGATLYRR
jgi:hypothetical protein